jgi:hypothetical protein
MTIIYKIDFSKTKEATCKELKGLIEDNIHELSDEITSDLSHIDDRACSYTGLEIISVSHSGGDQYSLEYKFDYNIYNGCSDLDVNDDVLDSMSFTVLDDGELEFDFPEYEKRSTFEEL